MKIKKYKDILDCLERWSCARNCGVNFFNDRYCITCVRKYTEIYGGAEQDTEGLDYIYSSDDIIRMVIREGL